MGSFAQRKGKELAESDTMFRAFLSTPNVTWGLLSPNVQSSYFQLQSLLVLFPPHGLRLSLGEVDSTFSSSSRTTSLIIEF